MALTQLSSVDSFLAIGIGVTMKEEQLRSIFNIGTCFHFQVLESNRRCKYNSIYYIDCHSSRVLTRLRRAQR